MKHPVTGGPASRPPSATPAVTSASPFARILTAARPWLPRTGLVLVGTTVGLLFAELGVRWLYGSRVVLFPRYHTDAYYNDYHVRRLRPNTTFWHRDMDGSWKFVTNTQGFRDTGDYRYAKPPGTLRVLCLGDSHTEGFEVRQDRTFSEVMKRSLRRGGRAAEVMNAGISGAGTAEELVFLENEGIKYAPDFVVVAFSANDPDDNVKCDLFRVRNGELVNGRMEYAPAVKVLNAINSVPPIRWLSENSYFYSVFFNQVWLFQKKSLLKERSAQVVEEFAVRPPDPDRALFEYQCDLTRRLMRRMYDFCQRNGIRMVILEIPAGIGATREFEPSIPEPCLGSFRESCDALFLSSDVLRDYRGVADVFVPHGQQHISETTHLLVGVAVADKIEEMAATAGR